MSVASTGSIGLINRAVLLVVLTRVVPLASAPVTLWLVATTRPLAEQGAYFIFWNVQALTQLMEVGAGALLVQFASHESGLLTWGANGSVQGEQDAQGRIAELIIAARRWYGRAAAGVLIVGSLGGTLLFAVTLPNLQPAPTFPWVITVSFTAAYLLLIPYLCVIEGSGELVRVQRMRLVQVVAAMTLLWPVLIVWGALWAVAAFSAVWYAVAAVWLRASHGGLLEQVKRRTSTPTIGGDIAAAHPLAPVQWRTAASLFAWWAAPQMLTPTILATFGPAAAGQAGMSLAIATAPLTLASAWLYGRYPQYGSLVASGRLEQLRRVAFGATTQAAIVCVLGTITLAVAVWRLASVSPTLAGRVLPPVTIIVLGVGNIGWLCIQSLAAYLRAWRQEPLAVASVVGAAFVIIGTFIAAKRASAVGTVAWHSFLVVCSVLPLVWIRPSNRRSHLHADS